MYCVTMQMPNNSAHVAANNAPNVKLPPISNGATEGTNSNAVNGQTAHGQTNGHGQTDGHGQTQSTNKGVHVSAKSQQLIYRSIPPKVQNFTLSDMLDSSVSATMKSKKPKGSSLTSSSEFAKRFMARPVTQPKVIDFSVGKVKMEKRRRGINGFFPPVKLRVSAKKEYQKSLSSPEICDKLTWRLPRSLTFHDDPAIATNTAYHQSNNSASSIVKSFDISSYPIHKSHPIIVNAKTSMREHFQRIRLARKERTHMGTNSSSTNILREVSEGKPPPEGSRTNNTEAVNGIDKVRRLNGNADELIKNETEGHDAPNSQISPSDESTFSILQNRWKQANAHLCSSVTESNTISETNTISKTFNSYDEVDTVYVDDASIEDNIRKRCHTKPYMAKRKTNIDLSIGNLRRFSSSLNLRQPIKTKLQRFSSSEYLNRSQSDLDDRITSKSASAVYTSFSVPVKAPTSNGLNPDQVTELQQASTNNAIDEAITDSMQETADMDTITRESKTIAKIRSGKYPTQISTRLQLVPTSFSEVRPRSSKSRSISRASRTSRTSVLSRKTPDSIRTAPPTSEGLAIYPETFDCDDLSYLPPPKRILPKRDVPWVFRYKVKRNMNELSKILASKPSQLVDA